MALPRVSWWRRLFASSSDLPEDAWRAACARLPWAAGLEQPRLARLRTLTAAFLRRKTITPVAGLNLSDDDRLLLSTLCCLPLLEFGEEGLHGWSQLIVYPDAFRAPQEHIDAAGVMHEWDDEAIGLAFDAGPLILSWADVCAEIEDPAAGFCVAVHEMAHKLDALDGAMDGTPPLPRAWQRAWAADFQRSYDAFCAEVDAGRDNGIDPYAAEAPDEFFAVCSEYHISAPELLRAAFPEVAEHLRRFYGEFAR